MALKIYSSFCLIRCQNKESNGLIVKVYLRRHMLIDYTGNRIQNFWLVEVLPTYNFISWIVYLRFPHFTILKFLLYSFIVFVCEGVCICHYICTLVALLLEVRRQLSSVASFILSCGSQASNSGFKAWQYLYLLISHLLIIYLLLLWSFWNVVLI